MKIRSKALYAYVLNADVLHGKEDDIAVARQEYRRIYKQQWKQQKKPRKEIRMEVTFKQFAAIKRKAVELGIPHTTYARKVILSDAGLQSVIPNKEQLLEVLQIISMAAIVSAKNTLSSWQLAEQLKQAEDMLLHYLKT